MSSFTFGESSYEERLMRQENLRTSQRSRAAQQQAQSGSYETPPDPYGVQFDPETGMPRGLRGPPSGAYALRYQYRGQEVVAQRNAELRRIARSYMDQAIGLSESYRPGGFATLHSGLYQSAAQTALASQLDEPDLLSQYREDAIRRAEKAAKRRSRLGFIGNLFGAAGSVIGGIAAGPGGAAAGGNVGSALGAAGGMAGLSPQAGEAFLGTGQGMMGGTGGFERQPGGGGAATPPSAEQPKQGEEEFGGGTAMARQGGGEGPGGQLEGIKIKAAQSAALGSLAELWNDGWWDGLELTLRDAMADIMAAASA